MLLESTVSLLEGVAFAEVQPGQFIVSPPPGVSRPSLSLQGMTPALLEALAALRDTGTARAALIARALRTDGIAGAAKMNHFLERLSQHAMLHQRLLLDGVPMVTYCPVFGSGRSASELPSPTDYYVLSRFACCRVDRNEWLLESPRGGATIRLHLPMAQRMLHELSRPCTAVSLGDAVGLSPEEACLFLNLLVSAEAVVPIAEGSTRSAEEEDPVLAPWEFHDLLFHTRSRLGRHDNPYGGTFPFKDRFPMPPVVKPENSTERITLYQPDLERLKREDVPFTQVLETRASWDNCSDPPLTAEQLGEFLYRSARIKKLVEPAGVSFRPSPAGGALHELEIYVILKCCPGIEAGLYHYNPLEHSLYRVAGMTREVRMVIELARITSQQDDLPQVVIVLAARFQRIQLKYRSVTYAVILKNVGVLFQTMYLVATAMGLAPRALGGGHSDLFAQAAGLNYYAETSVGEFLLNTRGQAGPRSAGGAPA